MKVKIRICQPKYTIMVPKGDKMRVLKTVLTVILISAVLCSCGAQKKSEVSMYDLCKAMTADAGLGDMTYVSASDADAEDSFAYISDFDYDKVSSWFDYFASDGAKCSDEIAVISVKNRADVTQAEAALKDHLEYRKSLYKTYAPDQLPKLNSALVFSNDIYAVLIVADNPQSIKTAFEAFI